MLRSNRFLLKSLTMIDTKSWFKPKKYPHIGFLLTPKHKQGIEQYIHTPKKIAKHAFLPLIKREQKSFRYKIIDGKYKRKVKTRPICYASHYDAQIYSFYARKLEDRFENYLAKHDYAKHVIAYRSIPRESVYGNKCNIDLANDAFSHIKEASQKEPQTVIITDISSFFDNLDHNYLKNAWKEVSDLPSLPDDEYNIFRNATRFSYVYHDELFSLFKDRIICQNKTNYRLRRVSKSKYLRDKNAIAFCEKQTIHKIRKQGLIHSNIVNGERKGIPQGLPISSVLANIYMWNFDRSMASFIKALNGYYCRYSDDIILVCPISHKEESLSKLYELIARVKLEISPEKTKIFDTQYNVNGHITFLKNGKNSTIEYLGLAFDGKTIRIKSKSISQYYRKMSHSIRTKTGYAIHKTDSTKGVLFVEQLLRRYTPIGSKKHKIFIRKKDKSFYNSGRTSFGNYWTYIKKAAKICNSPEITQQMHRNKAILRTRITQAQDTIAKYHATQSKKGK